MEQGKNSVDNILISTLNNSKKINDEFLNGKQTILVSKENELEQLKVRKTMISLREDVITKDDKGNDVVVSEITQESLDLDRRISSVIAEINLAKQEIDELIKKIRQLCREANELISNVLSFDGVDSVHIS